MQEITSRHNRLIMRACSLKQKKGRQQEQHVLVEGWRLITDALQQGIRQGICFIVDTEKTTDHMALYTRGKELQWQFFRVSTSVYQKLQMTSSSQGIIAMLPFFNHTLAEAETLQLLQPVVYLQDIQDPGNVGTIIRTAAACDVGAILLSPNCVDIYNDKVWRSAMGAMFKILVISHVDEDMLQSFCQHTTRRLVAAAAGAACSYEKMNYKQPFVWAFGNEGNGLSPRFMQRCEETVTIPMCVNTESLNVAISAGLILYKAWEMNGFSYEGGA